MSDPVERQSKLVKVELTALGRMPRSCPAEIVPSWAQLKATHKAVSGLFDTLHVLRQKAAIEGDPRGRLSEDQLDQVRAAIVFTSAGLDACLRRLLRDALPTLIRAGGQADGKFKGDLVQNRLKGELSKATKEAITDPDPRTRLIELYVLDLTGASLQSPKDLMRVRDGLGLKVESLADSHLEELADFFVARNHISHELDLIDPSGSGRRNRRHRDLMAVGKQCDQIIHVVQDFLRGAAAATKPAVNRS
ncbi:hypothetical protein FB384_001514 [Prauserella sediminis]|uniref:RiboL-PSP-HEPN domain-containing protein n=1 Tax=Prauserella sediminis TaxID=577680 RepID=A0A839XH47_9PSEU|nr:hypothetical protein [Prauserella sediminis]MBB3662610.1 hypothetical protein [Prauserella sediminis]